MRMICWFTTLSLTKSLSRLGLLGLLHLEIVQERLEREYGLNLIATAPSVAYEAVLSDGSLFDVANPAEMPAAGLITEV